MNTFTKAENPDRLKLQATKTQSLPADQSNTLLREHKR